MVEPGLTIEPPSGKAVSRLTSAGRLAQPEGAVGMLPGQLPGIIGQRTRSTCNCVLSNCRKLIAPKSLNQAHRQRHSAGCIELDKRLVKSGLVSYLGTMVIVPPKPLPL
jgi:hypothetical protein